MKAIFRLALGLCVVAVGAVLAAPPLPTHEVTTEFYANAQRTELVGESFVSCSGVTVKWGRTTPFKERSSEACDNGHPTSAPTASLLLRQDPIAVCKRRCSRQFPVQNCQPDGKDACALRAECEAACDALPVNRK